MALLRKMIWNLRHTLRLRHPTPESTVPLRADPECNRHKEIETEIDRQKHRWVHGVHVAYLGILNLPLLYSAHDGVPFVCDMTHSYA